MTLASLMFVNFKNKIVYGLTLIVVASLATPVFGSDIYIAQTAQGADTGANAADAHSVAWLKTAANWGVATNQLGPGTTVHLCGVITNSVNILGSGTPGSPITLLFETNCVMTAPYWTAITLTSKSNIVINGGYNGVITATASGTAWTNPASTGIWAQQCSDFTVENLTISNMYVRTSAADETTAASSGSCIADHATSASFHDFKVLNCVLHDAYIGINSDYGAGCSSYEFASNVIYRCNWGGCCGDRNSASTMTGLSVHDNHFYDWKNWNDTVGNYYHHNGFFVWANSGVVSNGVFYSNTFGPGWGGQYQTAGLYMSGGIKGNPLIYNNLFLANSGESLGNGMITPAAYGSTPPTVFHIYNNTLVQTGSPGAVGIALTGTIGSNSAQFCVTNNLGVGLYSFIDIYNDANSPSSFGIDYNVGYGLNTSTAYEASQGNNGNFITFATWQSYHRDPHGAYADPGLDADYMPQATSTNIIGKGVNLSTYFTTDKNGNPRPATGGWSIGAYQYLNSAFVSPPSRLIAVPPPGPQ